MKRNERVSYWLSRGLIWGMIFGFAVAFFVYQISFGANAVWCAQDDNGKCLREWMSALGGWAAVIAAMPTVYYLARQVSDTRRHERNNLFIQLRRQRLIAERAIRVAKGAMTGARFEIQDWRRMATDRVPMEDDDVLLQLEEPMRILSQPSLRHFETEIDVLVLGGDELRNRVLTVEEFIKAGPTIWSGDDMVIAANRFIELWESVHVYLENVTEHAEKFLRETDAILR